MPPHDTDAPTLFQCYDRAVAVQRRLADALDIEQLIHALERPVGLPVADDILGPRRPHPVEGGRECGSIGLVDVDRLRRGGRLRFRGDCGARGGSSPAASSIRVDSARARPRRGRNRGLPPGRSVRVR